MPLLKTPLFIRFVLPVFLGGVLLYGGSYAGEEIVYDAQVSIDRATTTSDVIPPKNDVTEEPTFVVTHISPPEPVKAVYMTSCIASGKKLRAPLVKLIETTELNAVIIDIKDFTGMISFDAEDKRFTLNTNGCVVPDMKEFIGELHEKGIYVIGRITVFQDTIYPKTHPDAAVKRKSDGGTWKDKKGLTFIDPGAKEYWEHMADLGKASYKIGFDEINYDYIRYPSDGNMVDIAFLRTGSTTKQEMLRRFYEYLGGELRRSGIPTSADLFGMTTTNTDDLGIGQIIEHGLRYFDFVAPMVYPSHYPPNFNGWKDPNQVPYEIIKFSMSRAVARAHELEKVEAIERGEYPKNPGTTTPSFVPTGRYAKKLRPWIQDFDYGKVYTEADVRAQIKATYDSGLTSWMSWDPSNKYTASAYDKE
jgi:hypothetical protein